MAIARSLAIAALILNLSACGSAQKPAPTGEDSPAVVAEGDAPAAAKPAPASAEASFDGVAACDPVADQIRTIMLAEMEKMLEGMPPAQREKAREQIAEDLRKEELVAECKRKPLTESQFNCLMNSQSMDELMKCEPPGEEAEPEVAVSAAVAARCETAVAHVLPLIQAKDADIAALSADDIADFRKNMLVSCGKEGFTEAQFECIMKAADFDAVVACDKSTDKAAAPSPAKVSE